MKFGRTGHRAPIRLVICLVPFWNWAFGCEKLVWQINCLVERWHNRVTYFGLDGLWLSLWLSLSLSLWRFTARKIGRLESRLDRGRTPRLGGVLGGF